MKKTGLLFAMVMMSFGVMNAQKTATLDVTAILNALPEKKKADQQLEAFSKTKEAEIEKQGKDLQAEIEAYQKGANKLTEAQRASKEQELQKKQQNLQQILQVAQKDLSEKQAAAYAPIEKKVRDAVAKVAKMKGWDFIFDINTVGLIHRSGPDATVAVKKELGL